mmetsp:Transcript_43107/g.73532  ORF Transcript_43107/g.73532 Transcript_43107/m.73532 type:complete len:345 (-) Transcript_43107:913-1947(-)|eukprot:CAMPEP_0183763746 /NCGR_PEP_ID=MMETSP0739-20130205/9898_1 /TAXON_ID=385413 /ORGANISM="Thalassiosira miniscula, Strain CCMP1093" /LENGTH=344 /DNA_ID=CAMNT_0026002203 /DNA_START=38 /DNA_END=1072 /DNA_ORIENTATION=-
MDMMESIEVEAVEVQVLAQAEGGSEGKYKPHHSFVMSSPPSINVINNKPIGKTGNAGIYCDDASTARTEVSTDIDDMSSLRENFTFGSLHLSDGGTFQSQGSSSFDASRIVQMRSKQGNLLSITELTTLQREPKCLMDLEDEDDFSGSGTDTGTRTTLGNKLSEANRLSVDYEEDQSNFATAGSYVGNMLQNESHAECYRGSRPSFASPSSTVGNMLHTESRAEFYGGCGRSAFSTGSTVLHSSESRAEFYGGRGRSGFDSTGSMFADGALNTDSRIGFYRVSCSDTQEPLSCREKTEQPAFGCDEKLFQKDRRKPNKEAHGADENRSGSIFSAVTCCFAPTQP